MNAPLLTRILGLLFQDSHTHRQVKDRLSDWILDRYALFGCLDDQALVEHLRTIHPQVFERLKVNPLVKDEIGRFLGTRPQQPSHHDQTAPSCACGATVPQEIAEYVTTQFGEVICVPCQQRRFGTTSRWR